MSTRLAVGVIGQNIVIDCGTHEEAVRLCETIASVITGREALPTDVPILRLTGEQMGSIDPPLSEDWFCDFDEYEEFVPLRVYEDALAEREALDIPTLAEALDRSIAGPLAEAWVAGEMTTADMADAIVAACESCVGGSR